MAKILRTPERAFRMAQWLIAGLLAFFLTSFSAGLIRDIPNIASAPQFSDFEDQTPLKTHEARLAETNEALTHNQQALTELNTRYDNASHQYTTEKSSFDHWRQSHSSSPNAQATQTIREKTNSLDRHLQNIANIEAAIHEQRLLHDKLTVQREQIQTNIDRLTTETQIAYEASHQSYIIKAFLIRLGLVGPILIAGLLLFKRYRQTPHWPFAYGFVGFALFAFFFELLPYLPSFGGYIRYGVGIMLTLLGGRVLIRGLQNYIAQKQAEQAISQEERKRVITYEKAITALAKDECPSCERKIQSSNDFVRSFCMHCGLKTHLICPTCGVRHNAFYPYCPSCGHQSTPSNE